MSYKYSTNCLLDSPSCGLVGGLNIATTPPRTPSSNSYKYINPWSFVSIMIKNGYWEYQPGKETIWRGPGSIAYRKAETLHRVTLLEEGYNAKPSWSIVFIGPFRRKWQFLTDEERHNDDKAKEVGDSRYVRSPNKRYVIFYDDRPRMDTTKK